VLRGLWSHRDLRNGVYDVDDLLDAHEALDWQEANEAIIRENLNG
jgi:hypothetical protein